MLLVLEVILLIIIVLNLIMDVVQANIPIAIIEAKENARSVGDGMQ